MKVGWEIKTIGEVCEVINGGTPKTGIADYWDGPHQWITPAEMGKRNTPYIQETVRKLTDLGLQNSSATPLPAYSVIMSSRAPIGHLIINTVPMATNQGCKGLIPSTQLEYKWLYHYLGSIVGLLNDLGAGATFKELSGGKLKEVKIPVPPLSEQQRIVSILDEAFDGIATTKANTEKNLQNARALFESNLDSVFSQRGKGWVEKPLSSFAHSISTGPFGSLLHKSDYVSNGVPLVNPINIVNGAIVPDGGKLIDQTTMQRLQSYVLKEGDVVIGRRGEIGRCAVVDAEQDGWICGTGCFFIRPLPTVNAHFIANLIRSSSYREQLERASTGATMLNLSNRALGELVVAVPSLQEQNDLLDQLDSLAGETQRLESIYQQKLAALEALKKSLLDQAFSGNL